MLIAVLISRTISSSNYSSLFLQMLSRDEMRWDRYCDLALSACSESLNRNRLLTVVMRCRKCASYEHFAQWKGLRPQHSSKHNCSMGREQELHAGAILITRWAKALASTLLLWLTDSMIINMSGCKRVCICIRWYMEVVCPCSHVKTSVSLTFNYGLSNMNIWGINE